MKKRFFSLISVLSLILIPSLTLAAWSEPSGTPPICPSGQSGCDAPINIGPSAQTKTGALTISTIGSGAGGMGLMVGSNTLVLQAAQNLIYGNIDSASVAGSNLLLLQNEDITKFVVTKDGNVGIGTTNPGQKLEVSGGTIKADNGIWTTTNGFAVGGNTPLPWQTASFRTGNDWRIVDTGHLNFNLGGGSSILHLNQNGNVGIGTTNPQAALDMGAGGIRLGGVTRTTWPTAGVGGSGADNYIPRWNGASDLENSVVYQTDAGNVGIGTTGPTQALHIGDSKNIQLGVNDGAGGSLFFRRINSQTDPTVPLNGAGIYYNWDASNNEQLSFNFAGSERMVINQGGNVGIGTTGPGAKLDIYHDSNAYTTASYNPPSLYLKSPNTDGDYTGIGFSNSGGTREKFFGVVQVAATSDDFVWQGYNGSAYQEYIRIKANGNVGIGTAGPTGKLHVYGAITGDFLSKIESTNTYGLYIKTAGTTASHDQLKIDDNTGTVFGVYATGKTYIKGNVGIGTTNPVGTLTVKAHNNGWDGGINLITSDGSRTFKIHPEISAGYGLMLDGGGQGFSFYGGDVRFNGGNVGIGTASPNNKLTVGQPFALPNYGITSNGNVNGIYAGGTTIGGYFRAYNNIIGDKAVWAHQENSSGYAIYALGGKNYFSGNVGIGTTAPGEKLAVSNNIVLGTSVSGSTAAPSFINLGVNFSNGTTKDKLKIYLYNGGGGEQYGFGVGSAGDVQYHSNGSHDFYINNSLKARIHTTSATGGIGVSGYGTLASGANNSNNIGVYGSGKIGVKGIGANNGGGIGVYGSAGWAGVYGDGTSWDFYAAGPGINYGPFTGGHEVILSDNFLKNPKEGSIVSVTGETKIRKDDAGKISISSTLPTVKLADKTNDKAVFGVFQSETPLPKNHWYKSKKEERFAVVNALGEGRVLVTNINGNVEVGDYITTSLISGHGQKQNDDLIHSYTLGKAIEKVNWDKITETIEFNGQQYKFYLIGVVYVSG